ncbi:hypothetical protein BDR06DRAFT_974672 [Suillus hirtellus]|nr:hypothetical protein BDR06DRAFT_974672 [Suillus hirtellus]
MLPTWIKPPLAQQLTLHHQVQPWQPWATLKMGKWMCVEAVGNESDGEEYEDACTKEHEDQGHKAPKVQDMLGKYQQWAKEHSFESILPGGVKAHKEKAEQAQQTINSHLTERKLSE